MSQDLREVREYKMQKVWTGIAAVFIISVLFLFFFGISKVHRTRKVEACYRYTQSLTCGEENNAN